MEQNEAVAQQNTEANATEQQEVQVPPDLPEITVSDGTGLTIQDIANAVTVIDFAAVNGAFKDWNTIAQVWTVRDRLQKFVKVAVEKQKEGAENQSEEAGGEPAAGGG